MDSQDTALAEVARVLRPGGTAYVAEPIAEGPQFELVKLVNDETEIRAHAYDVLKRAGDHGFDTEDEFTYIHPLRHKNFEHLRDKMVSVDADRAPLLDRHDAELRSSYDRLAVKTGDGDQFDQPIRVVILNKA